jgi:hypothetical protein
MFQVTCLAAPQRKTKTRRKLAPGNPQGITLAQHSLMRGKKTINKCNKYIYIYYEYKKLKDKMILRKLVQESSNLELWF